MKMIKNDALRGLALAYRFRQAGEGKDKDGQPFSWTDAHQIYFLPFEDCQAIKKLTVSEDILEEAEKIFEDIYWGALIEVSLTNGVVSHIELLNDCLKNYYETVL